MTQMKEKEWFAAHPHYRSIQHLCGIERLMESMISLLANKMIDEIPGLVNEMKKREREVRKEQNRFGAMRCGAQSSFCTRLWRPRSLSVSEETSNLSLVHRLPIVVLRF